MYTCVGTRNAAPSFVSMTTDGRRCPSNVVRVRDATRRDAAPTRAFTVCVPPLNMHFNDRYKLAEMIERNRMFGAQHFVFYNHSSGPDISRYLASLQRQGVAEVIQWPVPVPVDAWPPRAEVVPEVHYFAQLAALNDCLYRNMFTSARLVFTDLDEVIVPRHPATNWHTIIASVPPHASRHSLLFRNAFFPTDWPATHNATDSMARQLHLDSLLHTRRQPLVLPVYERSKYIVSPGVALMVGVHYVHRFFNGTRALDYPVPPGVAMLHHYRLSLGGPYADGVSDQRMTRFADELVKRVSRLHRLVLLGT